MKIYFSDLLTIVCALIMLYIAITTRIHLLSIYEQIEELKEDSRKSNQVLVLECGDEMGKKVSAGSR